MQASHHYNRSTLYSDETKHEEAKGEESKGPAIHSSLYNTPWKHRKQRSDSQFPLHAFLPSHSPNSSRSSSSPSTPRSTLSSNHSSSHPSPSSAEKSPSKPHSFDKENTPSAQNSPNTESRIQAIAARAPLPPSKTRRALFPQHAPPHPFFIAEPEIQSQSTSQRPELQALIKAQKTFSKNKIIHIPNKGGDLGGGDKGSDVLSYSVGNTHLFIKCGRKLAAESLLAAEVLKHTQLSHTIPAMIEGTVPRIQSAQDYQVSYTVLQDSANKEYAVEKQALIPAVSEHLPQGHCVIYKGSSYALLALKTEEAIKMQIAHIYIRGNVGDQDEEEPFFAVNQDAPKYLIIDEAKRKASVTFSKGPALTLHYKPCEEDPRLFQLVPPNHLDLSKQIDFRKAYYLMQKEDASSLSESFQSVESDHANAQEDEIDADFAALGHQDSSLFTQYLRTPAHESNSSGQSEEHSTQPLYLIEEAHVHRMEETQDSIEDLEKANKKIKTMSQFHNTTSLFLFSANKQQHYLVSETAISPIEEKEGVKYVQRNDHPYVLTPDGKIIGYGVPALFQEEIGPLWIGKEDEEEGLDVRKESKEREFFYANIDRQSFIDAFVSYTLTRSCDGKIATLKDNANFLFQEVGGKLRVRQIDLEGVMPPSNDPENDDVTHPLKCGLMGFPMTSEPLSLKEWHHLRHIMTTCVKETTTQAVLRSIVEYDQKLGKESSIELTAKKQSAYNDVIKGMVSFLKESDPQTPSTLQALFFHLFPSYERDFNLLLKSNHSPQEAALIVGGTPRSQFRI